MDTAQTTQHDSRSSLSSDLRRQLRYEINGAEITNVEKFTLEQKFGLADPFLLAEERQTITAEEAYLGR